MNPVTVAVNQNTALYRQDTILVASLAWAHPKRTDMTGLDKTPLMPSLASIKAMLANRPKSVTLPEIAKACDVSESWLKQVISGEIKDPSYTKVVAVHDFIKAKSNSEAIPSLSADE